MNDEWSEARNSLWLHEALFFKSVLESAGIEAVVPDEHTVSVQPFLANAIGGVRVLVRSADLERAHEVLESAARPQEGDNLEVVLREIAKRASGRPAVLVLFAGLNREAIDNAVWTIASESGRELERVNLAAVVSKWVAETEKNLNRIFADAERAGAVLVFDEADALFGREPAKGEAPDAGWLVEFLAKRKESFSGAVIVVVTEPARIDERLRKNFDYVLP